jgi:hypothetical protein
MNEQLKTLAIEVELQPGEKLSLPSAMVDQIGAGRWLVTVEPAHNSATRMHSAFLNGYASEDEGLYDDHSGG